MRSKIIVCVLAAVLATGWVLPVSSYAVFGFMEKYTSVKAVDGKVLIPIKAVDDGKAHHFVFNGDGTKIKFFVVKSQDGVIRAAFDACDVCFPAKKGYTQEGDYMICNNCKRKFHTNQVNVVEGGCNPAPLQRRQVGDNLVITAADILPGARFF